MPTFLKPLLSRADRGRVQLVNQRTGAVVATRLEAAFDSATRKRGLLGREGLADGDAVVIAPCFAVHTWFMRFPIDIVFAGRDGRVVNVRPHVGPWRLAFGWRAFATIELPAGAAARAGVRNGDRLTLGFAGAAGR
jgi:uncharacterized membrane protein (UPF0127 family)